MGKSRFGNHKRTGITVKLLPLEGMKKLESAYLAERASESKVRAISREEKNKKAEAEWAKTQESFNTVEKNLRDVQEAMTIIALWETDFSISAISAGMGVTQKFVDFVVMSWKAPREAKTTDLWCPWPRTDELTPAKRPVGRPRKDGLPSGCGLSYAEKRQRREARALEKYETKQKEKELTWPEIIFPDEA